MQPIFPENEYHTPENTPHHWGDKLAFDTRWYFILRYAFIVIYNGILAALNRYSHELYVQSNLAVVRLIEGCNGRFHVTGLHHLRDCPGPAVIVGNHMSSIDTNTLACFIWPYMELTYVAKASLVTFPFFGRVLNYLNPIAVSRTNPREDLQVVLKEGVDRLQCGLSIILFPQSTRTTSFIPEKFNSLGVKLARRARVPVIPMALKTDYWQNGRSILRDFGPIHRYEPIHIAFGAPYLVDNNSKQVHDYVLNFIQSHLEQWGSIPNHHQTSCSPLITTSIDS